MSKIKMMGNDHGSKSHEETVVDLGDDLLEKTALLTVDLTSVGIGPKTTATSSQSDPLETARIMISEGMYEDAKQILRQVLLKDRHNLSAHRLMEEVQKEELKRLMTDSGVGASAPEDPATCDEIVRDLDSYLGLGLFTDNSEAMKDFAAELAGQLAGLSAKDRIDIGIAFQEMGLHDLAISQFRSAERESAYFDVAVYLLSHNLIMAGRALEAVLKLEPVVRDADIKAADRVDFMYLLALAHERLKNKETALQWYRQIQEIAPGYRDTESRLRFKCTGV